MPNTYELIASSTVSGATAASIDFTSIPSTYTDLCLKYSVRSNNSGAAGIYITLNGSGTYTNKYLEGAGSGTPTSGSISRYLGVEQLSSYTASTFGSGEIYLPTYTASQAHSMSVDNVTENNSTQSYADLVTNVFSATTAINSVSIALDGGRLFVQYSTAYLYGVKNA
jgi:hypothetical protein